MVQSGVYAVIVDQPNDGQHPALPPRRGRSPLSVGSLSGDYEPSPP